jgi:hypothetical protein
MFADVDYGKRRNGSDGRRRDGVTHFEPSPRCLDGDRHRRAVAMGRTNPTYRDALWAIEERWADFRRALRRRD